MADFRTAPRIAAGAGGVSGAKIGRFGEHRVP
jgi:hypothetical protein